MWRNSVVEGMKSFHMCAVVSCFFCKIILGHLAIYPGQTEPNICACVRGVILWVVLSRYTYRSVLVVPEFEDVVGSVLLELMKWSSRLHLGI